MATERSQSTSKLSSLGPAYGNKLEIESVDIAYPDQVSALRARVASRVFDILFVKAGIKNDDRETIADV